MNEKVTGFDKQWDIDLFGNSLSDYNLGIIQFMLNSHTLYSEIIYN